VKITVEQYYSGVDIVRSDVLLRKHEDLEARVVDQAKNLGYDSRERVSNLSGFYESYLNHRLGSVKKGATIDFSTLVLAAGRRLLLNMIEVYDALKTDFIYHMQLFRKSASKVHEVSDEEFAKYEKMAVTWASYLVDLYLNHMHEEHAEKFREKICEYRDWFADMSFRALEADVKAASDEPESD